MKLISTWARSVLLMAVLCVTATALHAAVPGPPVEFAAKAVEYNPNGAMVKLTWMSNREGGAPEYFNVYMGVPDGKEPVEYEKIGEVEAGANTNSYSYLTDRLEEGKYMFYIVAVNADGESKASPKKYVTIKIEEEKDPAITIVSPRTAEGIVGKPWYWQVKIEKYGKFSSVKYEILEAPDGMTINPETGKIIWEHPEEGRHVFVVVVTGALENGETITARQEFVLEIGKGENKPCAEIVGTVKDELGNNAGGVIMVWMVKSADNNEEKWMPTFKAFVKDGKYAVGVPAGTYKLRFESDMFEAEWYEDAYELVDAKSVTVTCDQPRNEINLVVTKLPEPVFHIASGKVFDAESGEPLENALIVFSPAKKDNARRAKEVRTESNAEGNYDAKLEEGVTYFATAIARPPAGTKNLYSQEYWENTHDASLAKGISLTEDTDEIDFPMDAREGYENGFSGKLSENVGHNGVSGKVIAFYMSTNKNEPTRRNAETVETDDAGAYEFTNMVPGKYLLFGVPDSSTWAPGWYVDDETAAETWKHATAVEVGETGTVTGLDILLRKAEKEHGRGRISGHCYNSRGGIIVKSEGTVQGAIPVPGALVVAKATDGTIVDYTFADDAGAYSLEVMPVGQFTVTADRIWFEQSVSPVEITDESLDVTTEFAMEPVVTSVEVPTDLVGTSINLYPNPASTSTSLMLPTVDGSVAVRIMDLTGTVLATSNASVTAGTSTITIATATLPAGMYMVQATNGATTFALPLQIVR